MKDIIEILKEIYQKPEQFDEKQIVTRYGEDAYDKFSQYALGGVSPYVGVHPPNSTFKLTQEGTRELHRLIGEEEDTRRTNAMIWATIIMTVATYLMGIATFYAFLIDLAPIQTQEVKNIALILCAFATITFLAIFTWKGKEIIAGRQGIW